MVLLRLAMFLFVGDTFADRKYALATPAHPAACATTKSEAETAFVLAMLTEIAGRAAPESLSPMSPCFLRNWDEVGFE